MVDEILEVPEYCSMCGRPMGDSSDDQPDWPTGPMCGDCYQSRQMDDEIFWTAGDSAEDEAEA